MRLLTQDDLLPLSEFAGQRREYFEAHQRYLDRYRRIRIGPSLTLVFENRQTLAARGYPPQFLYPPLINSTQVQAVTSQIPRLRGKYRLIAKTPGVRHACEPVPAAQLRPVASPPFKQAQMTAIAASRSRNANPVSRSPR